MGPLKDGILPGYGDHWREPWRSFTRYCRAVQSRYASLGPDGLVWLREAGVLTVTLDQLHQEQQAAAAVLQIRFIKICCW